MTDRDYASEFNRFSGIDRLKLRGSALTRALTGFAKDDTREHPGRYPLYAAWMIAFLFPFIPGKGTAMLAATALWAGASRTSYALRLRGSIREAFNHASLMEKHKDFIEPHPEKPRCHDRLIIMIYSLIYRNITNRVLWN